MSRAGRVHCVGKLVVAEVIYVCSLVAHASQLFVAAGPLFGRLSASCIKGVGKPTSMSNPSSSMESICRAVPLDSWEAHGTLCAALW